MLKPQNCIVGDCASRFPYKDECAMVPTGCCARYMADNLAQAPDGLHYPLDLGLDGNEFVKALVSAGLATVHGKITRATLTPPPCGLAPASSEGDRE